MIIDTIYIVGMLIALLGFILFLLSETRIRIIDKEIKINLLDKIISSINYEGPFALTTDYLNKLTLGDNISIPNDLGDLNIKECIVEYIESLDVENRSAVTKKTISLYNQFV